MAEEPWYADGLRFECKRSGRCCTNRGDARYVFVDDEEIAALAAQLELAVDDFRERYCEPAEGGLSLRSAGEACVFLDAERHCEVHLAKPRQCRSWPFWPETLRSRASWEREVGAFCPGAGHGRLHAREEIERLARES